jgi:predicted DNA-binding protein (MmcQ/YjbR family)
MTVQNKASPQSKMSSVERKLRDLGLSYPQAHEDFPWGHRALKVKGKAFAFMANEGGEFSISLKLPQSSHAALTMPFTQPTEYGLGRSGWVTARFIRPSDAPPGLLMQWLEESYRAVASKNLVDSLDAGESRPKAAPRVSSTTKKKKAASTRKPVRSGRRK